MRQSIATAIQRLILILPPNYNIGETVKRQTNFYSHQFQTNQTLLRPDSIFAHLKDFEVNVQKYRQVSRLIGWSGIDASRSGTEFIQLQSPLQKNVFFNMIIGENLKSINIMLELLKLHKFHETEKSG